MGDDGSTQNLPNGVNVEGRSIPMSENLLQARFLRSNEKGQKSQMIELNKKTYESGATLKNISSLWMREMLTRLKLMPVLL